MRYTTSLVLFVLALFTAGCATVDDKKEMDKKGGDVKVTETKKCSGWGCANQSRPIVIARTGRYGYDDRYYRGRAGSYYGADIDDRDVYRRVPEIRYGRMDPRTGIAKALVDGVWRQCDDRNSDRWDSCRTREGERNAREWSASSAP